LREKSATNKCKTAMGFNESPMYKRYHLCRKINTNIIIKYEIIYNYI